MIYRNSSRRRELTKDLAVFTDYPEPEGSVLKRKILAQLHDFEFIHTAYLLMARSHRTEAWLPCLILETTESYEHIHGPVFQAIDFQFNERTLILDHELTTEARNNIWQHFTPIKSNKSQLYLCPSIVSNTDEGSAHFPENARYALSIDLVGAADKNSALHNAFSHLYSTQLEPLAIVGEIMPTSADELVSDLQKLAPSATLPIHINSIHELIRLSRTTVKLSLTPYNEDSANYWIDRCQTAWVKNVIN